MALFDLTRRPDDEEIIGSDAATRALSVTAVENDFVAGVYEKLASVYDFTFGPTLHPGRVVAIQRMKISPGDRVLEVGVGTGINASLYPRRLLGHGHRSVGLDAGEGAGARLAQRAAERPPAGDGRRPHDVRRRQLRHRLRAVSHQRRARSGRGRARDAPRLPARRPHHRPEPFPQPQSRSWPRSSAPSRRSPSTSASSRISTCPAFLAQAELEPISIEKVNIPRIWSLVTCVKE